ncbi:MAG: fimbrial biogenesis chaperone [Arenicella sp.]
MKTDMTQTLSKPSIQPRFHKHKALASTLSIITLFVSLFICSSAQAQRVSPMVFELEPFGSRSSTSLRIENTKQRPLTIEVSASQLSTDLYGREALKPADDDFLLFPPQAIIQPGKTQIIRVKYIGEPKLDQSQAYRIAVKQLPINIKEEGTTNIGIAFNFFTLLNITPKKTKPLLNIEKISPLDNQKWQLTIVNSGDRFARLSTTEWNISDTENKKTNLTLNPFEVSKLSEINFIAPKQTLVLSIPAIDGFKANTTKIAILTK